MSKVIWTIICFQLVVSLKAQAFKLNNENTINRITISNRKFSFNNEDDNSFIRFTDEKNERIVLLPIENFSTGTVHLKLRGKEEVQRNFIGLAFHNVDQKKYDAIYNRPFNFKTEDAVRKTHKIQYVLHPIYAWMKLREPQIGEYEKAVPNAPNPNDWFTLKLQINKDIIIENINDSQVFSVNKISNQVNGKIGIFMDSNGVADFEYIIVNQE